MCGQGSQLELELDDKAHSRNLQKLNRWDKYKKKHGIVNYKNHRMIPYSLAYIGIHEHGVVPAQFGYMIEGLKRNKTTGKPIQRLQFNTRCEGDPRYHNTDDEPEYEGPWEIFSNPYVQNDILEGHRCIIPVKKFIEWNDNKTEKWAVEYLNQRTMFIGGIYTCRKGQALEDVNYQFSICTMARSEITDAFGHHRSPLEIPPHLIDRWLDPALDEEQMIDFFNIVDGRNYQAFRVPDFVGKVSVQQILTLTGEDKLWEQNDDRWLAPQSDYLRLYD